MLEQVISDDKGPSTHLDEKVLSRCIVTPSMLVVSVKGVDPFCFATFFQAGQRAKMQLVGIGSILKNGVVGLPRDGEYHHVFNTWSNGYYHWLTEVAIKFFIFEHELRKGNILVPHNAPPFVIEFLNDFSFTNLVAVRKCAYANRLHLYSNPNSGYHNSRHIATLRDRIRGLYGASNDRSLRRVYVTRAKNGRRIVVNENDLITLLEQFGFQCVDLEGSSFREQVRMFGHCEILVSIHGAALSNSIFMPTGARVIELFPIGGGNRVYQMLSLALGNKHEYFLCEREFPEKEFSMHDNLVVDIEKMERLLMQL